MAALMIAKRRQAPAPSGVPADHGRSMLMISARAEALDPTAIYRGTKQRGRGAERDVLLARRAARSLCRSALFA